jgi:hypothetical protein
MKKNIYTVCNEGFPGTAQKILISVLLLLLNLSVLLKTLLLACTA